MAVDRATDGIVPEMVTLHSTCRFVGALVFGASIAGAPGVSHAQDITTEANWDIEAHVGMMSRGTGGGTARPLPVAEGFTTVTGVPSVAVSSWFFGDGTALFNRVSSLTGVGAAIVALDQALRSGITRRRGGIDVGFTAARWLSPRLAVQVQGDYAPSAVVMNDVTRSALESTARSYSDAWTRFLDAAMAADGVPFGADVTGDAELGSGRQFVLTGGLKAVVHTKRRFRTYVAGALGISNTWNQAPHATLNATYQFAGNVTTPSGIVKAPFVEKDDVSIRAEVGNRQTMVGSFHGGFEYYMESRRGMRIDVAVLLSPNHVTTFLDATPSVLVQDPGAAISGTTNPAIQFSSHPASVIRSSLTGPSIRNLATFEADGVQAQIKLALGYFVRF